MGSKTVQEYGVNGGGANRCKSRGHSAVKPAKRRG